jgi:hypothetical protein
MKELSLSDWFEVEKFMRFLPSKSDSVNGLCGMHGSTGAATPSSTTGCIGISDQGNFS